MKTLFLIGFLLFLGTSFVHTLHRRMQETPSSDVEKQFPAKKMPEKKHISDYKNKSIYI